MNRATVLAAGLSALVVLVIVGGFLVLDKTTLHIYTDESATAPTALPTARPQPTAIPSQWFYMPDFLATHLTRTYGTRTPPCSALFELYPIAIRTSAGAAPIVEQPVEGGRDGIGLRLGTGGSVRVSVECRP